MAIKIKSVQESVSDNGLKILVHAPAGTGKTVLGATAKEKTIIISAESGLLSLAQDQKTLIEKGSPDFAPEFCDVVEIDDLDSLSEVYEMLETDHVYSWVILDSITEIAEVVLSSELKKTKDPRQAYGALIDKMTSILKSFRDLPRYNVVMTCKQQIAKDELTGIQSYVPMLPGAKLTQQIPYLFDEVLCLRIGVDDETKEKFHYIQAVRDLQYEAKDRSGKLTDFEPPSLRMIADKIRGEQPKPEEVEEPEEKESLKGMFKDD